MKAENLLLDANLNIKIADFGFSNNFAPDGQLDTFCGSPPYAAPYVIERKLLLIVGSELFQGRKYTGPEVDVWSLGVILYVLCTGCLPFDGKDLKEMREVVCRGRYKVPFYLSEGVCAYGMSQFTRFNHDVGCEKLLRKFLVRDPTKRASLDMIADDPWLNDGFDGPAVVQELPSSDAEKSMDEEICRFIVEKFNVPYDQLVGSLKQGTCDDIAAIYMLLVDQKATGKWSPSSANMISPLSPVNLQQGSATPISRPTQMGTIGEEGQPAVTIHSSRHLLGNAVAAPTQSIQAPAPAMPVAARRERSATMTGAPVRQRPVTWIANDNQAQRVADDIAKQAIQTTVGSGPKLQPETPLPAGNAMTTIVASTPMQIDLASPATSVRAPIPAHVRHVTAPGAPIRMIPENGPAPQVAPQSPTPENGRTGGVFNAIRSLGRRLSENTAGVAAQMMANNNNGDANDDKPRAMRFTFNSNTTSTKNPDEIITELSGALQKIGVKHQILNRYAIECMWNFQEQPLGDAVNRPMDVESLQKALAEVTGSAANVNVMEKEIKDCVRFDIEVCELPRLKNLHGLRFKRLGGPSAQYKDVCSKILQIIRL